MVGCARIPGRIAAWARAAAGTALLAMAPGVAAEVVERPSPIEVVCPEPPTPVPCDGHIVLCYELHVTNFGTAPLTVLRVEVSGSRPAARDASASLVPLTSIADSTLTRSLRLVGGSGDPGHLGPGQRTILFVWLPLPNADSLARVGVASLRHRFTFQLGDSTAAGGGPLHVSMLDDVDVPVLGGPPGLAGALGRLTLDPPFAEGTWLAGNGPSNTSDHRRTVVALAGRATISQRFAVDWLKIGANGNTWHDDAAKLEDWWGFGEPIRSVADGEVTTAVDRYPDNPPRTPPPPVTVANIAGNRVIVRIGPGRFVMYAHLEHNSVLVRAGQRVKRGDVLARLGNSGNTTGPHLHFQVMDANSPLAAEGVPWVFPRFHVLGFGRDYEPDRHPDAVHRNEIPGDDMVVSVP